MERTVKSYEDALQLTKDRFDAGVVSGADVAQAQTQLDGARAQLMELGVLRAQYEHAIAILIGKPPEDLSISFDNRSATAGNSSRISFRFAGTASGYRRRRARDGRGERAYRRGNSRVLSHTDDLGIRRIIIFQY